jgi:fructosamine-3-kinase
MQSPTQRAFTEADVAAAARTAFPDTPMVRCARFSGGSFGTAWRVELADGRTVALKVGPDPAAKLLRYEAGMLGAEADYLRLVEAGAPDVPSPRLLYQHPDWLFMTLVPGTPLVDLPAEVDTTPAREQSGVAIARLHGVTGEYFGYPGDRPRADSWPAAYAAMVEDLIADAADWGVPLPVPADELRAVIAARHDVLAGVTTPVLLHFDLWDGNVLATVSDGVARLGGLVDGERYLFGDPMVDFASPWMLRDILAGPEHPFVRGYRSVRPFTVDSAVRCRYAFGQLYLYLVMVVEVRSRAITGDDERWRHEVCGGRVRELVAELRG